MTRCRECGANLPDGARTCLQCGTPVELSTKLAARPPLKFIRPAIAGGLLLGLLSSIPLINAGNLIFGLWIIAGGALTSHLLMRQHPAGISYADGAFGGVLSGFFGSIVATILLIPSKLVFFADFDAGRLEAERQLSTAPEVAGPMRDLVLRAMSSEVSLTTEIFWFFVFGIFFSLFAMFGGMLMVWISNRRRMKKKSALP